MRMKGGAAVTRRTLLVAVLAASLSSTSLGTGAARSSTPAVTCNGAWNVEPSPNANKRDNILKSVAAITASDVWAVGISLPGGLAQPLAEHWDGTAWSVVPLPPVGEAELTAVAGSSSADVWAVGSRQVIPAVPLAYHWDGSAWAVVPTPEPEEDTVFLAVSAVSSNDVWAVGLQRRSGFERALTMHWDGLAWSLVRSPSRPARNTEMSSVDAIGSDDVWAVGNAYGSNPRSVPVTMHWDGVKWRNVDPPVLENEFLRGVSGTAPDDVWAVGVSAPEAHTLTLHWDGSGWSVVPSPNVKAIGNTLWAVDAVAPDRAWAVGWHLERYRIYPLVLAWDGTAWTIQASPIPNPKNANFLYGVSADSTVDVWAVGDFVNTEGSTHRTLTEHQCA